MGHDTISHSGTYLGFEIDSGEVINYGDYDVKRTIDSTDLYNISNQLDKKFKSFLKKKFNYSIPIEFSSMFFYLDYKKLLAAYEVIPITYPNLVYGYDMEKCIGKQKNLNAIKEIKFPGMFPKNCLDILAEFLAEYNLEHCHEDKVVKLTNTKSNYGDDDDDEDEDEDADDEEESEESEQSEPEREALPESDVKKLKESISKQLKFGLHGFVH